MIIFYIITAIVLLTLAYVFWLIWKEQEAQNSPPKNAKENNLTAADLLDRLNIQKKPNNKKRINLKSLLTKLFSITKKGSVPIEPLNMINTTDNALNNKTSENGTAALTLNNVQSNNLEKEVDLSIRNEELTQQLMIANESQQKVETLLKEKNEALEKIEKELDMEQKHRKDFNKVKDLLEKELKEAKDETKQIKIDLNNIKSENQAYTSRILQLEEKIKKLEKDNADKDNAIIQLEQKTSNTEQPPKEENSQAEDQAISTDQKNTPPKNDTNQEDPKINTRNKTTEETTQSNNPLGLDPVSNLEEHYHKDAAPQAQTDTTDLSFHNEGPGGPENNDNQTIGKETVINNDHSTELTFKPIVEPKKESDHHQSPQEIRQQIDKENDTKEPQNDTSQAQIINNPEADKPQQDSAPEEKTGEDPNKPHLNPDIFKDIEKQFKLIEEEMRQTDEKENISIDDDNPDADKSSEN